MVVAHHLTAGGGLEVGQRLTEGVEADQRATHTARERRHALVPGAHQDVFLDLRGHLRCAVGGEVDQHGDVRDGQLSGLQRGRGQRQPAGELPGEGDAAVGLTRGQAQTDPDLLGPRVDVIRRPGAELPQTCDPDGSLVLPSRHPPTHPLPSLSDGQRLRVGERAVLDRREHRDQLRARRSGEHGLEQPGLDRRLPEQPGHIEDHPIAVPGDGVSLGEADRLQGIEHVSILDPTSDSHGGPAEPGGQPDLRDVRARAR